MTGTADALAQTRTTDEELLAAVRAGEPHAFQDLRDRHWPTAVAVARLHTPSRPDAEQLAGTAFDQTLADLPGGDGPGLFLRARLVEVVGRAGAEAPHAAGAVSRVYLGLPPSWQAVLWHTEVEGLPLDRSAELLGLSPAATTALHLEARAGLRAAYRQTKLDHPLTGACEECARDLGAFVDGALPAPRLRAVETHLDGCPRCTADLLYLQDTEASLRGWVLPVLAGVPLWGDAAGDLGELVRTAGRESAARPAAPPGADLAGGSLAAVGAARRGRRVLLGAGALAAAAALAGVAVTGPGGSGDGTTQASGTGGTGVRAPGGPSSTPTTERDGGRALAGAPVSSGVAGTGALPSLPVVEPSPGPLTAAAAAARSTAAARGGSITAAGGASTGARAAPQGDDVDRSDPSDRPAPGSGASDQGGTPEGAATGGGATAPRDETAPPSREAAGPAGQQPGTPSASPGPAPVEEPGTSPATDPGTPPPSSPGPAPVEEPGTSPATDPGTPPPSSPGPVPVEEPGTSPAIDPSTPPAAEPGLPLPENLVPSGNPAPVDDVVPDADPAPGGADSLPGGAGPAPNA